MVPRPTVANHEICHVSPVPAGVHGRWSGVRPGVGERRAGAPLRFVMSGGDGFDGQLLVFDPPEVMEFTWGTDRLRIELRPDGASTVLILTDTFDELGKAARDGAGWHECLDRLVAELDGTPQRPMGDLWTEVHPRYVTHLGPDAATIGPPPGNDPRGANA